MRGHVLAGILCVGALAVGACAKVDSRQGNGDAGTGSTTGGGTGGRSAPPGSDGGSIDRGTPGPDALISSRDGCTMVSCTPAGGQYCGMIGDGCGQKMDCGACPTAGDVCERGLCVRGEGCMPLACQVTGGQYC